MDFDGVEYDVLGGIFLLKWLCVEFICFLITIFYELFVDLCTKFAIISFIIIEFIALHSHFRGL